MGGGSVTSASGNPAESKTNSAPSVVAAVNLRSVEFPERLRNHPLVSQRCFYTLPPELWAGVRNNLSRKALPQDVTVVDDELSELAASIPGCVGFDDCNPIIDYVLRPAPPLASSPTVADYLEECRGKGLRVDKVAQLADQRFNRQRLAQQGYRGWLLTGRGFIEELRAFWLSYRELSSAKGLIPIGVSLQAQAGQPFSASNAGTSDLLARRPVDQFCRRWRLTQIVAPLTLRPLSTQFPAMLPLMSAAQSQFSGSLLFIPDIAPLPDRDELRQMAEDLIRQTTKDSPHLTEWFKVVAHDNQGRKTLHRYARWLPLQHYLRVLHGRYTDHLKGANQAVADAVGEFLEFSSNQLRRDLADIRAGLGEKWWASGISP